MIRFLLISAFSFLFLTGKAQQAANLSGTGKGLKIVADTLPFLRQGDHLEFVAKMVNLSDKELTGQAQLELVDAATEQSVDGWFQNVFPNQYFTIAAGQSELVKFPMEVPYQFMSTAKWRVVARADTFSDLKEALLPIVSNQILVTETLPFLMRSSGSETIDFAKLKASAKKEGLLHKSLTQEYASHPAWLAVQSLPSLMEMPYESSYQIWNSLYANAIARYFLNQPQTKTQLSQLFDKSQIDKALATDLEKLKAMQSPNGGFVWFKGGPEDRLVTQSILIGIGRLQRLNVLSPTLASDLQPIIAPALSYLDKKLEEDYTSLLKLKTDLKQAHIGNVQQQYLYLRSFFIEPMSQNAKKAYTYYRSQAQRFWMKSNKYAQGATALAFYRTGDKTTAATILRSLKETAATSSELGMYWKDNIYGKSPFWYTAPIETQSLLIEAFSEIGKDNKSTDALCNWLLRNKKTNGWRTTNATADAVYALLLNEADWTVPSSQVSVKLGNVTFTNDPKPQTSFFRNVIEGTKVTPDMGQITLTRKEPITPMITQPVYGAVHWQYYEDLDKATITSTPFKLSKKLLLETKTGRRQVEEGTVLHTGDTITIRIELNVERDIEYVHLKDQQASSLQPVDLQNSYKWQGGLGYYQTTKNASTSFFFSYLKKGKYIFEYPLVATHAGDFAGGVTTIQSLFAPEFSAYSEGRKVVVE